MNTRYSSLGLLAVLLLTSACDRVTSDTSDGEDNADASSPPLVDDPIGPLPGEFVRTLDTENPLGQEPAVLREGRELFLAYNCYGCHGGRAGGGMGPSLRDGDWLYGGTGRDIFSSISQGRRHSMPAWGAMLPEEIVWKLTAYIQSLRTDLEPDRPR